MALDHDAPADAHGADTHDADAHADDHHGDDHGGDSSGWVLVPLGVGALVGVVLAAVLGFDAQAASQVVVDLF